MVKSCDRSQWYCAQLEMIEGASSVLGRKKLLFWERILEANKFIVGSSFSGPRNDDSHLADCFKAKAPCLWVWP